MPLWAELPSREARWPSWKTNVTMPVGVAGRLAAHGHGERCGLRADARHQGLRGRRRRGTADTDADLPGVVAKVGRRRDTEHSADAAQLLRVGGDGWSRARGCRDGDGERVGARAGEVEGDRVGDHAG